MVLWCCSFCRLQEDLALEIGKTDEKTEKRLESCEEIAAACVSASQATKASEKSACLVMHATLCAQVQVLASTHSIDLWTESSQAKKVFSKVGRH